MADITGQQRTLIIDTDVEAIPGVPNGTPAEKFPEMAGGGFGINENPLFDKADIEANLDAQPSPEAAGFEPGGPLMIIPAPFNANNPTTTQSWLNWMLSKVLIRTSGALDAHTISEYNPLGTGKFTRRFAGCKFDGITLSFGSNNRLAVPNLDIKGMFPEPYEPGSAPSPTFPTMRHWNFTLLGVQAGGAYDGVGSVTKEKFLRSIEIKAVNGSQHGEQSYRYRSSDGALIKGASSVNEGQLEITGTIELKLEDYEWINRCVSGGKGHLRMLGFHGDSPVTLAQNATGFTTDPASATVIVEAEVGDGPSFADGDTVFLENSAASDPALWKREVLEVSGVSGDDVTLFTQGQGDFEASVGRNQTFSTNSRMYKLGCELLIRELTVSGWNSVGGAADKIYQRVPFRAGIWVGTHPTHGAGYTHKALDFMVR